ncbi:hypothetical protein [Methylobacterium sp. CM6247]
MSQRRRGHRDFDALTEAQLIAGQTASRRVCLKPTAVRSLAELLDAIDHVAEAATGNPSFLHLKPGSQSVARDLPERQARLTLVRSEPLPVMDVFDPARAKRERS